MRVSVTEDLAVQIGQLAPAAGVAVDTVRHDEKQGLLPAPPRRGVYRAYGRDGMAELERVRAGLRQVLDACPGHGALADCPILASLAAQER